VKLSSRRVEGTKQTTSRLLLVWSPFGEEGLRTGGNAYRDTVSVKFLFFHLRFVSVRGKSPSDSSRHEAACGDGV
jgi:hypothetical protein